MPPRIPIPVPPSGRACPSSEHPSAAPLSHIRGAASSSSHPSIHSMTSHSPCPCRCTQKLRQLTDPSAHTVRDVKTSASSILSIDSGAAHARGRADLPDHPSARRGTRQGRLQVEEMVRNANRHDDYMRQLPRRWRAGDVYSPHDMSPSEMNKWRKSTARQKDLVDMLGLRPLDMYRNFSVISEFMTPHGRIKRSVETGLNPVNQRKMAKAIRRAIGLGLHPRQ
ncbi:hypothetical protein NUW58_g3452 [Xylaria curta]|uniref:Uncharacterized protein n=1 Tax=Xylaria curta TaxID=42375 RepID=A0ACC1PC56_9PEZI|nr:hypothetical protein NUW58_g3452 [Xylaria curta]